MDQIPVIILSKIFDFQQNITRLEKKQGCMQNTHDKKKKKQPKKMSLSCSSRQGLYIKYFIYIHS